MILYYVKYILLKKIKIYSNHKFLNLKINNNFFFTLINQIRFLWRSKLLVNLLIIYYYLVTSYSIKNNATILIEYLTVQFRIIFSKYEQKLLLYLLLNLNKIFLNLTNIIKYNYFNNLILLQIIITGRWQRKRWVTPFPKTYTSSSLEYNKLLKKYIVKNYYISYSQNNIWTRKGNIGIRGFLLYNRK